VSHFSLAGVAREKAALRVTTLAARKALPEERRRRFDAAIAAALDPLVRGKPVAGYVPMAGEPGGVDLMRVLETAGRLLLPVLREDLDLDWAPYSGALVPGRLGLREPDSARLGVDAVASVSLIVVPAVAVDRRGMRLGRGGGSYDRALARAASAPAGPVPTLAVLYPDEVLDAVPAEPHDRPVSGTVTPSGVFFRPSA
jgi:5-formyltetrahydrofolate cyclo-ligase